MLTIKSTFDVRLLDSGHTITRLENGEEINVQLYGKTRDNQSITIICPDFKPYCHIYNPSESLLEALRAREDVVSVKIVRKEYKNKREVFGELRVRSPWSIREIQRDYELQHKTIYLERLPRDLVLLIRSEMDVAEILESPDGSVKIMTLDRVFSQRLINKYRLLEYMREDERQKYENRAVFFAADIVFTNRFIYDMDLETCIKVTGDVVEKGVYSTDIVLHADPNGFEKCPIFTPKLRILSFDIETSIKHGNIYCICATMLDETTGVKTERQIVSEYGTRDDMAIEEKRARTEDEKRIIGEFIAMIRELDPDVVTGYNINNFDLQVLFERFKIVYKPRKNDGVQIMPFGRDDTGVSRKENKTTGFVTWDVKGRLLIDTWLSVKKELRPKREGLAYVSQQLFGDTKDNINSTKMDEEWTNRKDEVVKYCSKDADLCLRILTNPRINTINKLMDVAIPSKLPVKEVAGGQNRMIESLLIRMVDRENIAVPMGGGEVYDYEGGFVYETKPGLYDWVIGLDFSSMYPSQIIKHNICFTTYTTDPDEAAHKSPIGAMFVSTEQRHGIIPQMVAGLLDSRKEAKAMMKKAKANGDKDMEDYYNRLQAAIKVLANATYGYFGAKFCRWPFNRYIAPSITAYAREEIQTVVANLEERGFTVIAGDTDSVFFISKDHQNVEACKAIGFEVQKKFSEGNMHLELEKVMDRFFAHAKKRYFGRIIWPEESLLIRGYEPRRTDSFDLQSETMTKLFQIVLDGKPDEAVKFSKETIEKTLRGKTDLSGLVISKSVQAFEEYDNPNLVQVSAARKLQEMGYEFTPGMKVPFIITSGGQPLKAEPVIEGVPFTAKPDHKYYAERLATALARITEAFGCDERTLLQGTSQRTLDLF